MANPHANHHHHLAAVMLVSLLVISSSSVSSSARLLNHVMGLAATEPTLHLAVPTEGVVPEKEEPAGHVSACGHMGVVAGRLPPSLGMRVAGGKYGPLILNMLPKGTVPPSGPSKGTNNLNN